MLDDMELSTKASSMLKILERSINSKSISLISDKGEAVAITAEKGFDREGDKICRSEEDGALEEDYEEDMI